MQKTVIGSRIRRQSIKLVRIMNSLDRSIQKIGGILKFFQFDGIHHIIDEGRHIFERYVKQSNNFLPLDTKAGFGNKKATALVEVVPFELITCILKSTNAATSLWKARGKQLYHFLFFKHPNPISFFWYLCRIIWLFIVLATCCGLFYMCFNQWARYKANPTVISLERDYRHWNGRLPAITLCYSVKSNRSKVEEYVKRFKFVAKLSIILFSIWMVFNTSKIHFITLHARKSLGYWIGWQRFWILLAICWNNRKLDSGSNLFGVQLWWRWTIT